MSLWSAHFEAPRITVLAPDPGSVEAGFRARHREAFAHPEIWARMSCSCRSIGMSPRSAAELLDAVEQARGKPTAIVVSTGADPGNIHLAIALKRACNQRPALAGADLHARDQPVRVLAAIRQGRRYAPNSTPICKPSARTSSTRHARALSTACSIRGAAIAHEHYNKGLGKRDAMSMNELQSAMRDWSDVLETYRAANRAVSDAAMTKVWDAGWRPAAKGEKGDTAPTVAAGTDGEGGAARARSLDGGTARLRLAADRRRRAAQQRSHVARQDRRLGRPKRGGPNNDVVQVRAAMDVARLMHKEGFVAASSRRSDRRRRG